MSDDVGKLVDIVTIAKRALNIAQVACKSGDEAVEDSKNSSQVIQTLSPKLRFLSSEIAKQIEILSTLKNRLTKRSEDLRTQYETLQKNFKICYEELEQIFKVLDQKKIDKEFYSDGKLLTFMGKTKETNVKSNEPEAALSLFDFVDIESIESLKQQTNEEMKKLSEISNNSSSIITKFNDSFNVFHEQYTRATEVSQLTGSDVEFLIETTATQDHIAEEMAQTLIMIANHYSYCVNILKSHNEIQNVEIKALENQTMEDLRISNKLKEPLDKLILVSQGLKKREQDNQLGYDLHVSLLSDLENFNSTLPTNFTEMKTYEQEFETLKAVIDSNYSEFANLIAWYRQFHSSYERLVVEIDRRFRYIEEEQQIVNDFLYLIEERCKKENEIRMQFWESHGQFLPLALCPSIKDMPTKRQVFPETQTSKLPKLSEVTISKAKKELIKMLSSEDFDKKK